MQSLYIHIPFCERKCLYCSFVVSVGQRHRVDEYLDCLEEEAKRYKGEAVKSIYVGGGTPTFLENDQLERLAEIIKTNFKFNSGIEMTIEANPEGIDCTKAQRLKQLAFNRVSLGIQSFQEKYLKFLGRCHDGAQALIAYENLREAGFKNINVDLMFSFPGQTLEEIKEDIEMLANLNSEHLSIYALTVEEHSRFYAQRLKLADEDVLAQQYLFATELIESYGLRQYEISNFAKPGYESQHNINYWTGGNYIGLGVGAHSNFNGRRFWNVSSLFEYMRRTKAHISVEDGAEKLSEDEQLIERLLFGLRMNSGVDVKGLENQFQIGLGVPRQEIIKGMVKAGFLNRRKGSLTATMKGRLVLDELCARLL